MAKIISADIQFTKKHGLNFHQGAVRYCKFCGTPIFNYMTDEMGNARLPMHLEIEDKTSMHYDCYIKFEEGLKKELKDMEDKRDAEFNMDEYTRLHKLPDEVLSES